MKKTLVVILVLAVLAVPALAKDRGHNGGGDKRGGGEHHGRPAITLGSVLGAAAGLYLLSRIDRCVPEYMPAPCLPVYQTPVYGPVLQDPVCQLPGYGGIGHTGRYDVPCVVESQGNRMIVNRPYRPGTQLTVEGEWVTDPNTLQPLYRREQGSLVVVTSNGATSLCDVLRGGANRGDDIIVVATPSPVPAPATAPVYQP